MRYIRTFGSLTLDDIPLVGGKNASFGEMIQELEPLGVRVPDGFAITADAWHLLLGEPGVRAALDEALDGLDTSDTDSLRGCGAAARKAIRNAPFPEVLLEEVGEAYRVLSEASGEEATDVAVRSSATAEDLPTASFAGQQESYLNVHGMSALVEACRRCFASLYTDRAISYREERGFRHEQVALSIGVQKMVRSDQAGAGVIFTLDTESGFEKVVLITAIYGLGENIVQGTTNPDEHLVFKPTMAEISRRLGSKEVAMVYDEGGGRATRNVAVPDSLRRQFVLSKEEVLELSRYAIEIERHYSKRAGEWRPMDIEWAKCGHTQKLYIVQARPETAHSQRNLAELVTYRLKERSPVLVTGRAVGNQIGTGPVSRLESASDQHRFQEGSVLVTAMTDPDWEPILKKASAIVTDRGGRTCHAAIVSRELGVPCVVGAANATRILQEGQKVTVSCAEGDSGVVMEGLLDFDREVLSLDDIPTTRTKIYVNAANPDQAFDLSFLPVDGVGLVREEFIVTNHIGVHPLALVHPEQTDEATRAEIARRTEGYPDPSSFFEERLAEGIARIAAAFHPKPVIVRLSDFKTNEYAGLLGGTSFEPKEENPMIGFRGASRYAHDLYREGFALECRALLRVRKEMGLDNVVVMIPFCRTIDEACRVQAEMARHGLKRGEDGLEIYVMCEIPANVLLVDEFAEHFDGFSIGSNDLTQLVLGVDRDSEMLSEVFDERNPAVLRALKMAIEGAQAAGRKIGICGQAPSDYPEVAEFLVQSGIDSISLAADAVVGARVRIAEVERRLDTDE